MSPSRLGKAADHPLPSAECLGKAAGRSGMAASRPLPSAGRPRKAADDPLRAADRSRKADERQRPTREPAALGVLSAVAGLQGSILLIEGEAAFAEHRQRKCAIP